MIDPHPSDTPAASAPENPLLNAEQTAAAERALVNVGDNVRASWRFSLDAVRANIHHMSEDARELLVWAFLWCIDDAHPVHFSEFCTQIDFDTNTVWKIYSGKYLHPVSKQPMDASAKMVKALKSFRRGEAQRVKLDRVGFVMTPTAKKIYEACDLARESQSPVLLEGASHIGKTVALRDYSTNLEKNHGRSPLVELDAVSGLGGIVRAIGGKVGVSPSNTPDMVERIKKALKRDMVLILDEVHLLANTYRRGSFFACMETIRRLYDFSQCGLVLSFTSLGFANAERERKRELEQIFRRGVHRINLGDRPLVGDVEALANAWGFGALPEKSAEIVVKLGRSEVKERPFALLGQLALNDGAKAITERMRYATKLAADTNSDPTWEHFVRADLLIKKNATAPVHGWGEKEAA